MIKLLSVAIFAGLFFASNQQPACVPLQVCWTQWYNRDSPSETGDWETISSLRRENPGKICPKPVAIEAQTITGLSAAAAGDVIFKSDTTEGFVCRNEDQVNKTCDDYRVRFSCPPPYCEGQVCWTQWYNRDNPSDTGDWETISSLRRENPGKICSKPVAIEAQTITGLSAAAAGDVIFKSDTTEGFVCRNKDQINKTCDDYRVRFSCPPLTVKDKVLLCWTQWYNRDSPSETGDWETISSLRKENPGKICEKPLFIQAVTTDTNTPADSTGDIIYVFTTTRGFVCRKQDQESGVCHDYKVRFGCPC